MSAKETFKATESLDTVKSVLSDTALNTSQKIRALHALEIPKAEIALILNKRYQHVRNVLLTKLTTESAKEEPIEPATSEEFEETFGKE